jgi:hypothetical protein
MKKFTTFIYLSLLISTTMFGQLNIDTLAIQDFEMTPATPTWGFTGSPVYNSGTSTTNSAPASSPIGVDASRAWEITNNSGGITVEFDNIIIPAGYDSIQFEFRLAAMCLTSTAGGPDNAEWVLVEYSTDNGNSWVGRLRIRGGASNNAFWSYNATGVGKVYYQPTTEAMFQAANSGLATTDGYSTNGITFPGNVGQVKIRISSRSSTTSDTWLVDNVVIRGVNSLTTGVKELESNTINIYPNPARDVLFVSSQNQLMNYQILDITGKTVKEGNVNNNQIEISNFDAGVYFVRVKEINGWSKFRKIQVIK